MCSDTVNTLFTHLLRLLKRANEREPTIDKEKKVLGSPSNFTGLRLPALSICYGGI